jgi:hypothetical protein
MATHRIGSDNNNNDDDFCVSLKKIFKHCFQLVALKSATTPKVAPKVAVVPVVPVAVAPGEMERIVIPPIDVHASMLMALPTSLRIKIFNYFDEKKQEELRTLSVISKQLYEDCQHPSIEWEFIPVIEISPKSIKGGGSTRKLLYNLIQHQTDYLNTKINTQITPYRAMKVNGMHQFDDSNRLGYSSVIVQLDRITSLHISWLYLGFSSGTTTSPYHLPKYLSRMLPNLLELVVSNTIQLGLELQGYTNIYFENGLFINEFTKNCPRLEKITWNNNDIGVNRVGNQWGEGRSHPTATSTHTRLERIRWNNNKNYSGRFLEVNGINMKDATHLRVLMMDNCTFSCACSIDQRSTISDLENYPHDFLFQWCCTSLERVSIRKATDEKGNTIQQEALIKFVRSVPTLRWFRSDLHPENMELLTTERPDMEFC